MKIFKTLIILTTLFTSSLYAKSCPARLAEIQNNLEQPFPSLPLFDIKMRIDQNMESWDAFEDYLYNDKGMMSTGYSYNIQDIYTFHYLLFGKCTTVEGTLGIGLSAPGLEFYRLTFVEEIGRGIAHPFKLEAITETMAFLGSWKSDKHSFLTPLKVPSTLETPVTF